jgi:large subunit ribosomal protein L21
MYAVIETGGKQYRVEVGTELEVEYLDVQPGDAITIDRVLLVADGGQASIGQPVVADALVRAEVVRQDRGEKVISFKYRPKARRRVKKGHRQELTVLRVTDVRLGDRSAAEDARSAEADAASERQRLQEAAARQAAADAKLAAELAASRPADAPASTTARRRGAGRAERADAAETTADAAETTPEAAETEAAAETSETAATADAPPKRTRASKAKAAEATADAADATADDTSTDAPAASGAKGEDQ